MRAKGSKCSCPDGSRRGGRPSAREQEVRGPGLSAPFRLQRATRRLGEEEPPEPSGAEATCGHMSWADPERGACRDKGLQKSPVKQLGRGVWSVATGTGRPVQKLRHVTGRQENANENTSDITTHRLARPTPGHRPPQTLARTQSDRNPAHGWRDSTEVRPLCTAAWRVLVKRTPCRHATQGPRSWVCAQTRCRRRAAQTPACFRSFIYDRHNVQAARSR